MQTKNKPSQKFIHVLLLLMFLFGTAAVRFSEQKSVSAQSGNTILAESTFDTSAEGWGIINDGTVPTHSATGGSPDGYIQSTDLQTGAYWYWSAPSEFLGNQSAAYGGNLTYYLRQSSTSSPAPTTIDYLIFSGGGVTITYKTSSPASGNWTPYNILLSESAGWKIQGTQTAPTQTQMQAVLANLQFIHIRGEFRIGADTGKIDSVYLKSAPFTPTPTLTSTPTATATFTSTPTATATFTPLPGPTAVTGCNGATCEGLYPSAKGCDSVGRVQIFPINITYLDTNDLPMVVVENRYSPDCDAQWTLIRNETPNDYFYVEDSIRWPAPYYQGDLWSEYGRIPTGSDYVVYTRMHAGSDSTLTCGSYSATDEIFPTSLTLEYKRDHCFPAGW